MEQTLFYLFVSIFAVTAIITLLGITGVIKTIKDKYLNALFTALILEVVAAVFVIFNRANFFNGQTNLGAIIEKANLSPPSDEADYEQFVISSLKKSKKVDSLNLVTQELSKELNLSKDDFEKLKNDNKTDGQGFYGSINFLHQKINEYKREGTGKSINVTHDVENKQAVYEKLLSLLSYLGLVREGDGTTRSDGTIDKYAVRKKFESFKRRYTFEEKNLRYIEEYDLTQMIRNKLRSEE